MNLQELIELIADGLDKYKHKCFLKKYSISQKIEIDPSISTFIKKFKDGEVLMDEDINQLQKTINVDSSNIHRLIIGCLFSLSLQKLKDHSIEELVNNIDQSVVQKISIEQKPKHLFTQEIYTNFLNIYWLTLTYKDKFKFEEQWSSFDTAQKEALLAINAYHLTGYRPLGDTYCGIDLTKPLYPSNLYINEQEKLTVRHGIKNSDLYFPYKRAYKLCQGGTGNNTLIATDGRKFLFVRGVRNQDKTCNSVFASKIATLISKTHFASERLLNNKLGASRKLPAYAISILDSDIQPEFQSQIDDQQRRFPGTGMIDEVTNFLQECDINSENFGLSTTDLSENTHLSKIDYDHCSVTYRISEKEYEQNMLGEGGKPFYESKPDYKKDPQYINEKLYTRLKLVLLTEPILRGLADKSYDSEFKEEISQKELAITECTRRSNIALTLFLRDEQTAAFLKQNPQALNKCQNEIVEYIHSHFKEEKTEREAMLKSLEMRVSEIKKGKLKHAYTSPISKDIEQKQTSNGEYDVATSNNVKQIREFANTVLNDSEATQLQKDLAKYILNKNQYSLKHAGKFGFSTLFTMRTFIPNNHENALAKLKLAIAANSLHDLRSLRFSAEQIKHKLKQQCIEAIYDARSMTAYYGVAHSYSCKSANSLEKVFGVTKEVNEGVAQLLKRL